MMKLKGKIRKESSGDLIYICKLHDGTPFSMPISEYDVELNENFDSEKTIVDGWLFVTQEAQQDSRCYLTLPKPTLQFGKQIVVNEIQLMPLKATLNSFNPHSPFDAQILAAKAVSERSKKKDSNS